MEQVETVLLEYYGDINCYVYVKFDRINGEIKNKRYIVVWVNATSRGNKCLRYLEQVMELVNKLKKQNSHITKKDSGDKIVKMVILGTKWGEWNV